MKVVAVALKAAREQLRSPLITLLTIGMGSFFVLLIGMFFPSGGSTTYSVVVANADTGPHGARVVAALRQITYGTGASVLTVSQVPDASTARATVTDRRAVLFIELPSDFSVAVESASTTGGRVPVVMGGDLSSPTYPVAAILVGQAVESYLSEATGRQSPLAFSEVALGTSASRTEFDLYVPGVLIFAVGIMLFSAAMALAQEVESGTVQRLVRTPAGALSLLGGITLNQTVLGVLAGVAALGTASLLGFSSAGPLWLALPIWTLTSLSVIGLGLLVASITRSVAQAFLVANIPFGVFMFLSGTMFPISGIPLFTVAGQEVNLLDVLPQRHAVNALTAVFGYGSTDITYELVMLTVLSVTYFGLGVWAFHRRHLRVPH